MDIRLHMSHKSIRTYILSIENISFHVSNVNQRIRLIRVNNVNASGWHMLYNCHEITNEMRKAKKMEKNNVSDSNEVECFHFANTFHAMSSMQLHRMTVRMENSQFPFVYDKIMQFYIMNLLYARFFHLQVQTEVFLIRQIQANVMCMCSKHLVK